jgi:hypothetical protein
MKVTLCPECSSNKVEADVLNVEAECSSCGWKGPTKSLIVTMIGEDQLAIAERVSHDLLVLFSRFVTPAIGSCMVAAGLVGARTDREVLTRILKNSTVAAHEKALQTIEQIQKEQNGIPTA